MRTNAGQDNRSGKYSLAPRVLFACVPPALVSLVFACGGSGETVGSTPTQSAGAARPTVALPPVAADSAEKAGLLVYRDTVAGQIFALNLSNEERLPVGGIAPGSGASITAFDCTRDGRLIVYVNPAASGRVSVVTFAGEGAPKGLEVHGSIQGIAWAPDGARLAMNLIDETGFHLALLDVGSGELTMLPIGSGTPGLPRWSPEGQHLVLDINENGRSDIYVLEIGNSSLAKISTRPSAFTADWSPDAHTIVFSAGDEQGGNPQIYAVDADGNNERKLTSSDTQKWAPRWSLDGTLISYAGALTVPVVSALPALSHTQAVWVAGADGTNESPVTDIAVDAFPFAWCLPGPWLE